MKGATPITDHMNKETLVFELFRCTLELFFAVFVVHHKICSNEKTWNNSGLTVCPCTVGECPGFRDGQNRDRRREAGFVRVVELGKLAREKAVYGQVRKFGAQMETAQTQANSKQKEVTQRRAGGSEIKAWVDTGPAPLESERYSETVVVTADSNERMPCSHDALFFPGDKPWCQQRIMPLRQELFEIK